MGFSADLKDAGEEVTPSDVDAFEKLRIVLRSEGLEEHVEPDEVDEILSCDMLSYTGIHYSGVSPWNLLALGKPRPPLGNWVSTTHVSGSETRKIESQLSTPART